MSQEQSREDRVEKNRAEKAERRRAKKIQSRRTEPRRLRRQYNRAETTAERKESRRQPEKTNKIHQRSDLSLILVCIYIPFLHVIVIQGKGGDVLILG